MGIFAVVAALQFIIIEFGSLAFHTAPLSGWMWASSVAIGALSLLVGMLVRLTPDQFLKPKRRERTNNSLITPFAASPKTPKDYQHTIQNIYDRLGSRTSFRGGEQHNSGVGAAMVLPGLLASMLGTGHDNGDLCETGMVPVELHSVASSEEQAYVDELADRSKKCALSLS